MKVVLFGDSLLKGLWKDLLIDLEKAAPGSDVYNCSVSGWDTSDAAKKAAYIAQLKPDVIIFGFGTNDAAPWKQVPIDSFLENIKQILDAFKDSKIIYFLPPPVREDNDHNKEHRRFPETVKQYHDAAKQLLDDKKVKYIDSFALFEPLTEKGQEYHIGDGVHFNDLGYQVLIYELARLIKAR